MYRLILHTAVCFTIMLAATPQGRSQDNDGDKATSLLSLALVNKEIDALGGAGEASKAVFKKMENPPLAIGDAGRRVRGLQATLNRKLGGDELVQLRRPINVGPAVGNGPEKNQLRLASIPHLKGDFLIRGDWKPCESDGGDLVADPATGIFKSVDFLKLPPEPLKIDGVFGQHTQAAVAVFQLEQGLPITGDVDAVTLDKLEPMIPDNRLLALIMNWVCHVFDENVEGYPYLVKHITSIVMTLLILLASLVVYQVARTLAKSTRFLSRWLFTPTSSPWFTALLENHVFLHIAQFAPAAFIYFAARIIFPTPDFSKDIFPYVNTFQDWQIMISRLGLAYVSLVLMLVGLAVANAADSVCNPDQQTDNPIGSIIRASKRIVGLIGTLLICASLVGKPPFVILGGLGAFMAIFVIVFKDFLLSLVSSVQIIANRVVQVGDWVTMPKYNADGDVRRISLTLIKVQNFDKTISTIPTSAVLMESFQNWTGMQQSGGRRIKRSIHIDMRSIQVCTPEMIERFQKIELISEYIKNKKIELEKYNSDHEMAASLVNVRRLTNIGTFRAYLDAYLENHPGLHDEMTFLVRHLEPTRDGLPIEIYAFCKETDWSKYEAVQADIFEHVLAVLPEFGLLAYQGMGELDRGASTGGPETSQLLAGMAETERLIEAENQQLSKNPRSRLAPRIAKVKKLIAELHLGDYIEAVAKGRRIVIRYQ